MVCLLGVVSPSFWDSGFFLVPEMGLRAPSSNVIATGERGGWIGLSSPSLRVRRMRWTGPLLDSAPRGLGEGDKGGM